METAAPRGAAASPSAILPQMRQAHHTKTSTSVPKMSSNAEARCRVDSTRAIYPQSVPPTGGENPPPWTEGGGVSPSIPGYPAPSPSTKTRTQHDRTEQSMTQHDRTAHTRAEHDRTHQPFSPPDRLGLLDFLEQTPRPHPHPAYRGRQTRQCGRRAPSGGCGPWNTA